MGHLTNKTFALDFSSVKDKLQKENKLTFGEKRGAGSLKYTRAENQLTTTKPCSQAPLNTTSRS